jgi:hypothetical protein
VAARVDVQRGLEKIFEAYAGADLFGLHRQFGARETLTVAHLSGNPHYPVVISPLQYEEIDIGEILAARCIRQGLWLAEIGELPFALLLSPAIFFGRLNGPMSRLPSPQVRRAPIFLVGSWIGRKS